jgi:3',5'-cyclic-AMP phosphodiesterase
MKFIQITDLHIDQSGECPFNIDVRKNFFDVLDAIITEEPDHLIITGDLCYRDGDKKIYKWIKTQLDALPFPYEIIAGNHDDSVMMANVFDRGHLLNGTEMYFAKKWAKQPCLFLDSAVGKHSDNQIKWLKRQMKNCRGQLLIFMHHPPFKAGAPYMDNNYALQDMHILQALFEEFPHQISVFCGHYHIEKTVVYKNVTLFITPSCFFQIGQTLDAFSVDHHQIAYRIIDIEKGILRTTVRYLQGNVGG